MQQLWSATDFISKSESTRWHSIDRGPKSNYKLNEVDDQRSADAGESQTHSHSGVNDLVQIDSYCWRKLYSLSARDWPRTNTLFAAFDRFMKFNKIDANGIIRPNSVFFVLETGSCSKESTKTHFHKWEVITP